MPIYEPDLSYEDMKKDVKTFKCAKCDGILVVAWSGKKDSYMLRCGQVLEHEGIVPLGRDPWTIEVNARLRGGGYPMRSDELKKQSVTKMITRVDQARFPQELNAVQKKFVAVTCIEYGLDPIFGELMLYQGKPYVTIDARRRKAQESGKLDGIESRPATQDERKERRVETEDYLFRCDVWLKDSQHPCVGWGRVTQKEIEKARKQAEEHGRQSDALPIVKDPAGMAEKRAEAMGLRRGFHIPLPSFEEIVEGEFAEVPGEKDAPGGETGAGKKATRPVTPGKSGRATQPQLDKILRDGEQMGYRQSDLSAIIKHKWGADFLKDLTVPQASTLIDMISRGEGIGEAEEPAEES